VDEDATLRIWACSPRRSALLTVHSFLDMCYNNLHSEVHPMYYLQVVTYGRIMLVCFINPLDANLLYEHTYH
jgi:hypothetical protein